MSYVKLLHLMHKRLITKPNVDKKYIIRFKNKKEYTSCIANIKKLLPQLSKLSAIQPIHTLNAICCSMRSAQSLLKHKGILFIEEDMKIKYHLAGGASRAGDASSAGDASRRALREANRAGGASGSGATREANRRALRAGGASGSGSGGGAAREANRKAHRGPSASDLPTLSSGYKRSDASNTGHGPKLFSDSSGPNGFSGANRPTRSSIPWGVMQISAPQTWRKSAGNRVKIGIIDTGIDYTHNDLRLSVAGGVNFVRRFYPAHDDNGHGTHIAGTIAAGQELFSQLRKEDRTAKTTRRRKEIARGKARRKGDATNNTDVANSTEGIGGTGGIIGVAPKSSLYAIKAFDKNGSAFVSDIILGIDWCVRNKMDIINMSFGMKNKSISLRDAIKVAHDAGLIIVASSGNEGKQHSIDFPARFAQTIAVGATSKTRQITPFSNRGKGINIYAPGDHIYSAWSNNKYNVVSGTSMATSHVTGVIALMLSLNPNLTTSSIKALLKRTASPLKGKSHVGEVNALKAVQACLPRR